MSQDPSQKRLPEQLNRDMQDRYAALRRRHEGRVYQPADENLDSTNEATPKPYTGR